MVISRCLQFQGNESYGIRINCREAQMMMMMMMKDSGAVATHTAIIGVLALFVKTMSGQDTVENKKAQGSVGTVVQPQLWIMTDKIDMGCYS